MNQKSEIFSGFASSFDLADGIAWIAWNRNGVSELRLPDHDDKLRNFDPELISRNFMLRKNRISESGFKKKDGLEKQRIKYEFISSEKSPDYIRSLFFRIQTFFDNPVDDFLDIPLDYSTGTAFEVKIWKRAREIPPGTAISYGELADDAGYPGAARAVGRAMSKSPVDLLIPAHRVIASGNKPGGWTGGKGIQTKLRLLSLEGIHFI